MESAPSKQYQTHEQAKLRKKQIIENSIFYKLNLDLISDKKYFSGTIEISFQFNEENHQDSFLDFSSGILLDFSVNGQNFEPIYNTIFLTLPRSSLQKDNVVIIKFKKEYVKDGCGFHQFIDSDMKRYLYTMLCPYLANRFFPCFDQPDLKAYFQLSVMGETDWQLISNELTKSVRILENKQYVEFNQTPLLSCYLFVLVAGPYSRIECPAPYKNLPMNLFCRHSLKNHLEKISDFIFEVTNKSFEFYEKYFQTEYVFSKYDQIYVAEFKWNAMENAGAVTFRDGLIPKQEPDILSLTSLAITISHELSHHWFGNLVTMQWWNDLWLNESFAEFISHFCLSQIQITTRKLQDIWISFNVRKLWGYREDSLKTTHPIACNICNTEQANYIFDGITYAKGGACLRQLLALIGRENFSNALGSYFKEFRFRNAVLEDFINHLQLFFGVDFYGFSLDEWKYEWIQTAGLNKLEIDFCDKDYNGEYGLNIHQSPYLPEFPTLRRHKIMVAFFTDTCEISAHDFLVENKPDNYIQIQSQKIFKAVILNYQDYSFVKTSIDPTSQEFFKLNLYKITDQLTKIQIWKSFYDMVLDGLISSEQYINMFLNQIQLETSTSIILNQFNFVKEICVNHVPSGYQQIFYNKLFQLCLGLLDRGEELRVIILKNIVSFGVGKQDTQVLFDWYFSTPIESLKNAPLGIDQQWLILDKIMNFNLYQPDQKVQFLNLQIQKDSSSQSVYMVEKYRVKKLQFDQKKILFQEFLNLQNPNSLEFLRHQMIGFNTCNQEFFLDLWSLNIDRVFNERKQEFAICFYNNLMPFVKDLNFMIGHLENLYEKVTHEILKKKLDNSIEIMKMKLKSHQLFLQKTQIQL